jgi:hypothetical protein
MTYSGGEYVLTLADKYNQILMAQATLEDGNYTNRRMHLTNTDQATKKCNFQLAIGGASNALSVDMPSLTALMATATYFVLGTLPRTATIQSIKIVATANVATNGTNFVIYRPVIKNGTTGATVTTVGQLTTSTISFTAFVARSTTVAQDTVGAGNSVVIQRIPVSAGVATPKATATLTFTDTNTTTITAGTIRFIVLCRNSTVK